MEEAKVPYTKYTGSYIQDQTVLMLRPWLTNSSMGKPWWYGQQLGLTWSPASNAMGHKRTPRNIHDTNSPDSETGLPVALGPGQI